MQTISSSPRKAAVHLASHGFCEDHHSHAKAAGARSAARRTLTGFGTVRDGHTSSPLSYTPLRGPRVVAPIIRGSA